MALAWGVTYQEGAFSPAWWGRIATYWPKVGRLIPVSGQNENCCPELSQFGGIGTPWYTEPLVCSMIGLTYWYSAAKSCGTTDQTGGVIRMAAMA